MLKVEQDFTVKHAFRCLVFFLNMIHDKHNLQNIIVKDCLKSMYFIRYFPIPIKVYFIRKK